MQLIYVIMYYGRPLMSFTDFDFARLQCDLLEGDSDCDQSSSRYEIVKVPLYMMPLDIKRL